MKGHMEKDGFHPHTDYKGVRKSRDQQAKTEGVRLKRSDGSRIKKLQFKVWKYDDAPEELQEKIIEKLRQSKFEFGDNFFAEDEGIIFDEKEKKDGSDIGLKNLFPKYYDVGSNRGTDFVQFEFDIEDEKKLAKYLGISEKLRSKIQFGFKNDSTRFGGDNNTKLEIRDATNGEVVDLDEDFIANPKGFDNFAVVPKEDRPTMTEYEQLQNAMEKWDDLMSMALRHLTLNYEDQFTDATLAEDARANEYEFDEDGNIT